MTDPSPQELEILAEASRLLTSTLDLTEVLDHLADIARTRLETEVARIWLLDEAGLVLSLAAHKGRVRSPLPAREQVATGSSLVGWVCTNRRPLALADVQQDPRLEKRAWFKAEGFVSLLCVPILLGEEVIGILSCMTRQRREFRSPEIALAEALTASAAVAVRNARLHAETVRRLAEIEAFQRVAADTLCSPDVVTALEAVVREIPILLRSDGAACSRVDPRTGALETVTTVGTRVRSLQPLRLEPGHGLAGLALREKRSLRTDDYFADPRFTRPPAIADWAHAEGIVSMVTVPVTDATGDPIALLWAFNRSPRPFTARDEMTLTGLARQAALVMDNARLVGDLRRTLEELQAAQDTLVRGATLRAVGELAAGAAHHLNNLMAVVLGRSQLLLYRNRDPEMGWPPWSARRWARFLSEEGRDADEDAALGVEPLPDVAAHDQRDQQPVLAPVGGQQRRLQVRAPVDPLGVALEGGAVLRPHVDGDPAVVADPARLEAVALGREVHVSLVRPEPGRDGTGLARPAVGRHVQVAGPRQGGGQLRGRDSCVHDG